MNWGTMGPALGTLGGAGLTAAMIASAPATGGLSLAALPAIGAGGAIGGAAGMVGGQLAPKDNPIPAGMPPPPKTQLPNSQQTTASQFGGNLQPGQGGFLRHPFVG